MTTSRPVNIAVIGCGNISKGYGDTLRNHSNLVMLGATDIAPERAAEFVKHYGGKVYATLEELLADPAIELVINLTIHHAHYDVIKQSLNAGKHVYSEKPLALTYPEARELVELAAAKNLRLSCAPMVFLGEAQQTAWKLIREGKLGKVRVAYAEVNWARIETWHPNPVPFYGVGPMFDVGVYPLSVLTTIFGAVKKVSGYGTVVYPDRKTQDGRVFQLTTPDFIVAMLEHANGALTRLTTNFYVPHQANRQHGIEFHGDLGSLHLKSWFEFNAGIEFAPFGEHYKHVELVKTPYEGVEWSRGVADMASAIVDGTRQRVTGAQAAHIVDIIASIQTSYQNKGVPVTVESDFTPPPPMEWSV